MDCQKLGCGRRERANGSIAQKKEAYGYNMTGWWFQPTPLKNDGRIVSWDDEIPN